MQLGQSLRRCGKRCREAPATGTAVKTAKRADSQGNKQVASQINITDMEDVAGFSAEEVLHVRRFWARLLMPQPQLESVPMYLRYTKILSLTYWPFVFQIDQEKAAGLV